MKARRGYLSRRRNLRPSPPSMAAAGGPVPVAIIVINRNGAAFLVECLESIFAQSARPDEIILVDDASTDESVAAVADYVARGLRVVALRENVGMSAARMAGFAVSAAPLLLFVDGDNVLPPDYLATMVSEMRPGVVFVYPGKRFFGDPAALQHSRKWHPADEWTPPAATRADLWRRNACDTCSLVRREDFVAAGGWRGNPADTMFDWEMFLRVSGQGGVMVRSAARLGYRLHGQNWSNRERQEDRPALNGMIRRAAASLTVATVWSGRLGADHAGRWLAALDAALVAAGKLGAELLVADDSVEGFPLDALAGCVGFSALSVRVVRSGMGTAERRPDRRATAEFLAGVFNGLLRAASGDVVWFVEDDILPPVAALDALLVELLFLESGPRPAVCGAYRSRHRARGESHWIAADYVAGEVKHWSRLPAAPAPVALTGTGCLLVLRDLLGGLRFGLEWSHDGRRSPAHDWTFSWALHERGEPVVLVPSVICQHLP